MSKKITLRLDPQVIELLKQLEDKSKFVNSVLTDYFAELEYRKAFESIPCPNEEDGMNWPES